MTVSARFEWDENKDLINRAKHGVSFEEAQTVFFDEHAFCEFDLAHSLGEDRFRILGRSSQGRALLVAHCLRENDTIIRIISSRKATAAEEKGYRERIK